MTTSFGLQMLKVTLEKLGVVKDWERINGPLIEDTIYGMIEHGRTWVGSYARSPDVEQELHGPSLAWDISSIRYHVKNNIDFPAPEQNVVKLLQRDIQNYKRSHAFTEISKKYKLK
ncbi:MAG: hypothetical protein AABW48_04480 [Nanoarchaeota archaeon]